MTIAENAIGERVSVHPYPLSVPGCSDETLWKLHHAWNQRSMSGFAIMELLAPFYSPHLGFRPRSPISDLHRCCREAVFWRQYSDLRLVSQRELETLMFGPGLGHLSGRTSDAWTRLGSTLHESLGGELRSGIGNVLHRMLGNILWIGGYHGGFGKSLAVALQCSLDLWTGSVLESDLEASLFYAVGFTLPGKKLGEKEKDFRPLLKLWTSGNLPTGFDQDGRLVILCQQTS